MICYLWGLLAALRGDEDASAKWTVSGACALVWQAWGEHLTRFLADPLFAIVSALWAVDFILGSALAWREGRYETRRGLYSVVKWLVWMAALAVGWAFRYDGLAADDWLAPLIGAAIVWTEGISILRNGARLTGRSGGYLRRLADRLEGEGRLYSDRWDRSIRRRRAEAGLPPTDPDYPGGA